MVFFYLITLTCEFRSHRAGSQLKLSESQKSDGNLSSLKFVKCAKCLCWYVDVDEKIEISDVTSKGAI